MLSRPTTQVARCLGGPGQTRCKGGKSRRRPHRWREDFARLVASIDEFPTEFSLRSEVDAPKLSGCLVGNPVAFHLGAIAVGGCRNRFSGYGRWVGYGSTVGLVRVSRGEARSRVDAAADVLPGRGLGGAPVEPKLPATAGRGSRVCDRRWGCGGDPLGAVPHPHPRARRAARRGGGPATDVEVDLRTAAQRDADALVELTQRALANGELPTEGGERPQVVVTVSLPVLQGRIGAASLALGGPINADIARRIGCDAQIIPVVLGSRGEPLDIGRASRTVPAAIRRAVIVRDRGCAFQGAQ